MLKPLISVVMPVYNNERYFPLAVTSILEQSFKNIEIIVVNDGSTDNTGKIANELAQNDNRVRVIHQDNQWIYASFNNGIKAALGDYIFIVNSDDALVEGALELLASQIIEFDYPDVIYVPIKLAYCDDMQKVHKIARYPGVKDCNERYVQELSREPQTIVDLYNEGYLFDQANLYKREKMLECPFRNDFYAADGYFNLQIAKSLRTIVSITQTPYIHYIYDEKNMNVANKKYFGYEQYMYDELYTVGKELLEYFHICTDENLVFFVQRRKQRFSATVRRILEDTSYDDETKLDKIFSAEQTDIEKECFSFNTSVEEAQEEYEARILSELRRFFSSKGTTVKHFSYDLVESLLHYEYDDKDIQRIHSTVYNVKNRNHIGKTFYEKILYYNKNI